MHCVREVINVLFVIAVAVINNHYYHHVIIAVTTIPFGTITSMDITVWMKIWWWCYLTSPSPSLISISIITSTTIETGNITRIDMTVCMNVVNIRKWWNCDDEVGPKRFLRFLEPTNYTQLRTRVQSCLNLCPIIFRHASKHWHIKKYSGKRCVQSFPYIVFQNRWPLLLTIKKS